MATWDEDQLADEVLRILNIVGSGQTASYEDLNTVKKSYASEYLRLRKLGLVPFPIDQIDPMFQEAMAEYIAGNVASRFFSGQRLAEHTMTGKKGWVKLKSAGATGRHHGRSKPEYM